jgi:hypothetical protein
MKMKKSTMIVASVGCLGLVALAMASQRVKVESPDGRYRKYKVNISSGNTVRLVRQLSSSDCRKDRDWGWDRTGIWVDNGCRAEFEIRSNSGSGDTQRVTLESVDERRKRFNPRRDIRSVRLIDQKSDRPCRQNRTWGWSRNELWVDDGCRAVFEVRYR